MAEQHQIVMTKEEIDDLFGVLTRTLPIPPEDAPSALAALNVVRGLALDINRIANALERIASAWGGVNRG